MDKRIVISRIRRLVPALLCLMMAVLLLMDARSVSQGVRNGLALCGQVVIPSLFPFMALAGFMATSRVAGVLAKLLYPVTRFLLRLPKQAASPLLMGLIGGFPVGARTLALMVREHRLSPAAAGRMLCFCVNAGPPFLLTAVGVGMLHSLPLGCMLLAAQVGSSLLIGIGMGLFSKQEQASTATVQAYRPYAYCFVQSVGDATTGMLGICAFVILFSALQTLLLATGAADACAAWLHMLVPSCPPELAQALLFGVLEVTNGCSAAASCGYNGLLAIACFVSFSSVSVIFQVMAATHGSGIPLKGFLLSRPVHALITLGLFRLLLGWFPQALQVAASFSQPIQTTAGTPYSAASLLFMCALFLVGRQSQTLSSKHRG